MTVLSLVAIYYSNGHQSILMRDEFTILIIAYYTVFILIGIPYFIFLQKSNYLLFRHFLLNGFFAGTGVLILLHLINWLQGNSLEIWGIKDVYLFGVFSVIGIVGSCLLWLLIVARPNKSLKSGTPQSGAP